MKPAQNVKYQNMYVAEVVDRLRETSSLNDKQVILKEAIEKTPNFKEFLIAVFNPHVQYNIKKIPEYKSKYTETGTFNLARLLKTNMLDVLSKRQRTGKEAIKYLEGLLVSLNPQDARALEMIIERDLKAGVGISQINKVAPGTIHEYPVMLCTAYDEDLALNFPFPAYSQIKCDGLRGNIIVKNGLVETKSRNGKDLGLNEVFEFIPKVLVANPSFVLDGEILVRDPANEGKFLPRKQSNGIINKCAKGTATDEDKKLVVFVAWDIIPIENFENDRPGTQRYSQRLTDIQNLVKRINDPRVQVVETREVGSLHEAKQHFTNAIERGLEGTILKDKNGLWASGRPKTQLKLKLENECDLLVKDAVEGSGKYKGKLGALSCVSADGLLEVSIGGGFSDEERAQYWATKPIGKIIAVRYNEKITNSAGRYSLFLPRLVEIREDKTEADTLDKIK